MRLPALGSQALYPSFACCGFSAQIDPGISSAVTAIGQIPRSEFVPDRHVIRRLANLVPM